jgi:hypothetical protein
MRVGEVQFAALVAPAINRNFRSAMRTVRENGGADLVGRNGGQAAVGPLIIFRHSIAEPGRLITWEQFAAVARYRNVAEERARVESAAGHGKLTVDEAGLRATDAGRDFLHEVWAGQDEALGAAWAEHGTRVDRLADVLARLVDAATLTGGMAFAAMTPTYEPPEANNAARVLNRLGLMRFHRMDAHAAAWSAAGLTAEEIQAMAPGPERDAIEDDTNVRAAPPYEVLSEEERLALLADLAALP